MATPSREERPEALFVAPAFGDDLVAPVALEVAPLAREHGRDVDLLGDDPEVPAEREPDPLGRRHVVGNLVERGVERVRALPHRVVEQLLLRAGERVERSLLHAELLREVAHRRPVEAPLGEKPRCRSC